MRLKVDQAKADVASETAKLEKLDKERTASLEKLQQASDDLQHAVQGSAEARKLHDDVVNSQKTIQQATDEMDIVARNLDARQAILRRWQHDMDVLCEEKAQLLADHAQKPADKFTSGHQSLSDDQR